MLVAVGRRLPARIYMLPVLYHMFFKSRHPSQLDSEEASERNPPDKSLKHASSNYAIPQHAT